MKKAMSIISVVDIETSEGSIATATFKKIFNDITSKDVYDYACRFFGVKDLSIRRWTQVDAHSSMFMEFMTFVGENGGEDELGNVMYWVYKYYETTTFNQNIEQLITLKLDQDGKENVQSNNH